MKKEIFPFNDQYEKENNPIDIVKYLDLGSNTAKITDVIEELFGDYKSELDFINHCKCGYLHGNYYSDYIICPRCGTKPTSAFCDDLSFSTWINVEDALGYPLLHPRAYSILKNWLGRVNKKSILDMILDVDADLPEDLTEVLSQGYKYFYENFDHIINFFENIHKPKRKRKTISDFLKLFGNNLWVKRLPILNRNLHIMTAVGKLKLVDPTSIYIVNTINELAVTVFKINTNVVKQSQIDRQINKIYQKYYEYSYQVFYNKVHGKKGLNRKNILGFRLHYTYRGVVTPIIDQHDGDELLIPWQIGVASFKLEIINILTKRYGYKTNEAMKLYRNSILTYNELIDEIFHILIKESPHRTLTSNKHCIFSLFGRNPVLQFLSIMGLGITEIKTDIHDKSINISPRILKYANIDFDGDELFGLLIKERDEQEKFKVLHPCYGFSDMKYGKISNQIKPCNEEIAQLESWLMDDPVDKAWCIENHIK